MSTLQLMFQLSRSELITAKCLFNNHFNKFVCYTAVIHCEFYLVGNQSRDVLQRGMHMAKGSMSDVPRRVRYLDWAHCWSFLLPFTILPFTHLHLKKYIFTSYALSITKFNFPPHQCLFYLCTPHYLFINGHM